MRVIRDQLHCNAISISGTNIQRLEQAATAAFSQGLQVWMQPRLFDATKQEMLTYLGEVTTTAESPAARPRTPRSQCRLRTFDVHARLHQGSNFQQRMATLYASPVSAFP